jgi:hypothetical protein
MFFGAEKKIVDFISGFQGPHVEVCESLIVTACTFAVKNIQ